MIEMRTNQIDARWRTAALGGMIGPLLFAALVVLGGVLTDGYSHVTQKISELGGEEAPYALLQNANFIVMGVLVIGFAWALHRVVGGLGPVLIGLFGLLSSIANGLLQCDTACNGETTTGLLHNITGLSGFVAAIAGMIVLGNRWRTDSSWQAHVRFTRWMTAIAIVGLVWFVATQAADARSLAGVAQRVFAGGLLVWVGITAWRLVRSSDHAVT